MQVGFPIAADDLALHTPNLLERTLQNGLISPSAWPATPVGSALAASMPGVVTANPLLSPPLDTLPSLGLDSIVGAVVAPAPDLSASSPHMPAIARTGPGLRLPSFASLGIANPYSDAMGEISTQGPLPIVLGGLDLPLTEGLSNRQFPVLGDLVGGGAACDSVALQSIEPPKAHACVPLQHYVTTLTPPHEAGDMSWGAIATVVTAPMDSPSTEPGNATPIALSQSPAPQLSRPSNPIQQSTAMEETTSWIDGAINATLSILASSDKLNGPLKVLSHALPCPSTAGHVFPEIITALHNQTPTSPTCWINVFHALPGRFNLADLPSSPPSTPGPSVGGDDYFTSKVFDSAVPISDYQASVTTLPRSPHPIVPPSTVNVAIVERYIPPTNTNEFSEMFSMRGPSLLVDRLVELSRSNGTLVFIYPTKKGGETFMNSYLGPILDPLLRAMVVVNSLGGDFGSAVGRMPAVDSMHSFEALQRNIQRLCAALNQQSHSMAKLDRRKATFSLEYAAKEEVVLKREVWAENWWSKQEKPRIRDTVTRSFRMARRLPQDSDVAPTNLIHEILDGVASRPYRDPPEPSHGVEVGVFVIRRSS